jgi:hypothetical protein
MLNTALWFALVGGAVGAGLVAVESLRRSRAKRARASHVSELRNLARRRGLSPLEDAVPEHVCDRATPRGSRRRAHVEDALLGRDDRGNYYALRRLSGRRSETLLLFDAPKDTQIDGFSAEPTAKQGLTALSRLWRRESDGSLLLTSRWECEPRALRDDGVVIRCGRALQRIARHAGAHGSLLLGLDIDGRRICVRTRGKLDVDSLAAFLDAGLALRAEILDTVMDTQYLQSLSGDIQPITDAVHSVVEKTLGRASRSIERVRNSRVVERRELLERQSGPWSTVMDIPPELMRRPHAAPEPIEEVEVVVLTGRGTPI